MPNSVDRVALLAIKSQITHDPHGVLNSWNDSFPICQWQSVTCGTKHLHRVVRLNLDNNNLVGTLSPYVGNLSFLHHLYLANNSFRGHIPPQIGHLRRLRELKLLNNYFEGQIPANLSHCLNLKKLGLALNLLSGPVSPQLGLLSNLEFLSLTRNRLQGDLLNKVVMNLTSLRALSASSNSFEGSIPDSIGATHTNLFSLGIHGNGISGTIPPSFYNLSQLQHVDLASNHLQGTLPFDIGVRLPQLIEFSISDNSFHGKLPLSFANLTHLKEFSIYSNHFMGNMFSLRDMPNLTFLEIDHNKLGSGKADDLSFLRTLVNCSNLQELECGGNNFGGIIPDSLGNISTLTSLDLQLNRISGSIPSGLFNLVKLTSLALAGNQLTGNLSPQIERLNKLEIFAISENYLTGNLPLSWGNLSHLSKLILSYNSLEGTIPLSLGNCTNLLGISIHNNYLSGALPPQLFHASSMLVSLLLAHNQLQGIIPVEIGQLTNLVMLDIAENNFSGELPTTLSSCNELDSLHMGGNFFTGKIPESFKSLTSLSSLNLSHNNLSGPIPNFLANFPLVNLDLSFNNFKGEVPRKGIFLNMSFLNIRGNSEICGGIPNLHLPTCPRNAIPKRKRGKLSVVIVVIIAVASLVVGVSIVSLVYFLLCSRRKQRKQSRESELNLKEPFSKVSYDMLLKATNRFSEANLVGAGRFGSVYKGVLDPENSVVVAVKVISLEQKGATKTFMAECEALRSIRHRNLLKIVTVCSSTDFQGNDFKALVYAFMPNGSLHQWIHADQHDRTLSLLQRVNIAIDVASALDYLHNGCDVPIIHCDLKPSNILLNDDMVAHVGDFGLARFHLHVPANNSSSVVVKGTVGYAAPEYGLGSIVSKEGDIYSYGIVLIEMMTSKNPTDMMFEGGLAIHNYAKSATFSNQLIDIIDPRLLEDGAGTSEVNEEKILAEIDRKMKCIRCVIEIGVKCSVESPQDRMQIEDAVRELQVTRDILLKNYTDHPC
ncbi:hypothetical protein BVRB_1g021560 [Beta vulgaris subsp. vulgaris]|uniref:non-specific serine/threonine protein kinase n=1 Tax=Beta vulgaris subsp. vulgaris TaxID=3555 RepID=A0A0J8BFG4_BETVV|nr:hypothetical protein BVRB_1g021560 [Beta vulgaris subsp. vulgaris]